MSRRMSTGVLSKLVFSIILTVLATYSAGMAGDLYAAVEPDPPCAPTPEGLTAWWGGDGNAADILGQYPGTLVNGAGFAEGQVGGAFGFDGNGERVDISGTVVGDFGADAFSIAFWMRTDTVSGAGAYILGRSHPNAGQGWDIRRQNSAIQIVGVNGWAANITTAGVLTAGTWHHVVLAASADTSSNTDVSLFVDGAVVGASPRSTISSTTNPVRFGMATDYGGFEFIGALDEIQFFDRALTEAEVQSVFAAGSGGVCRPCAEVSNGRISWWKGDNDASDEHAVNPGTPSNGAGFSPGLVDQAFDLGGVNDYIEMADDPSLQFAADQPMSIDLWAYRSGSDGGQHLIGKRYGAGSESFNYLIVLDLINNGGLCFGGNGASIMCASGGEDDLPLNTWTHIAGTFDGVTKRLYINANEVISAEGSLGPPDNATFKIGTVGTTGDFNQDFDGLMDEVALYDRALSEDEVLAIYSAGKTGKCALELIFEDGFESGLNESP